MTKTNTFDVTTPAGSDNPTQGDDRIRELKDAIQEREDVDHYWEKVGNIVDTDDVGYHRQCTFIEAADIGTGASGRPILGAQTVSGKPELMYTDEDDNDIQITDGGALKASTFVTGDWILSSVGTAHTGWTEVSATYAGKYIRIGATGLATGGSATHTHERGSFTVSGSTGTNSGAQVPTTPGAGTNASPHGHTHTFSGNVTGTSATGANAPLFVDIRIFQKD